MSGRLQQVCRTLGVAAFGLMCVLSARAASADKLSAFTALLNGAQETPPVASPSQGMALVTFNKDNSKLCYALSYSPLQGTEIVAHFHGPGAPGQSAPVLHAITPSPSPVGSPKHGCVALTKDDVKLLKKGLIYINVHSSFAPNGEIRGQVLPEKASYKAPAIGSPTGAFVE